MAPVLERQSPGNLVLKTTVRGTAIDIAFRHAAEAVVDKAAAELWAGLANHKAKQELDVADLCNLLHESEQDFSELLQQLDHGICRRITDVETRLTETLAGQMAAAEASAASTRESLTSATTYVAQTLDQSCDRWQQDLAECRQQLAERGAA